MFDFMSLYMFAICQLSHEMRHACKLSNAVEQPRVKWKVVKLFNLLHNICPT